MSGDDWAHLIYLAILLCFVLGLFTVGRRINLGRGVRDFLIWGLIFAMLVIAYGFQDTLKAGLFPSSTTQISGDTVELRRYDDGHFHADLLVNGQSVRFIVDTGATQLVLSREDARRVGIDLDNLNYMGRAQTANGMIETATIRIATLQLGDFVDRDVRASVGSGDLGLSLLGMDYLNRFRSIEMIGDRMLLRR